MCKECKEEVRNNLEMDATMALMEEMEEERNWRGGAIRGMLVAFAIEVWFAALIFLVAYFISMLG